MRIPGTRIAVLALLATLALLAGGREALWRLEHVPLEAARVSPDGWRTAAIRSLPEGAVLPYGSGVFVAPRWSPVQSLTSKLVFAAHCPGLAVRWLDARQLGIHCPAADAELRPLRSEVWGVSIHRTAASP